MLPQICPSPRELDDLELLLNGGLAPRATYDDVITLDRQGHDDVELVDPEGLPLARLVGGELTKLKTPAYGAFRRLHKSPAETKQLSGLTIPVAAPLTASDLATIKDDKVILLVLAGHGTAQGVTPEGLVRATLRAAELHGDAEVVVARLASHGDPTLDHELGQQVAANYAPGVVALLTHEGDLPDEIAEIVAQDQHEKGVVLFFTGLSGSGKSTLARALHDLILEQAPRTVTSLDGDVVRRNLSAGLTFSKEDRETNIRRIGWVAAEIARHGGLALCSPIAPFDSTRKAVRQMVEDAGAEFVLIHVATPLEECERRDRKGLYAKARAGEIPEFTGISSPYEEPDDATVRVDTTGKTIQQALEEILPALPLELPH